MLEAKIHGTQRTIKSHDRPDSCPLCHRHILAKAVVAVEPKDENENDIAEVMFICNNPKCKHMFISKYERIKHEIKKESHDLVQLIEGIHNEIRPYTLIESYPLSGQQVEINEDIEEISPSFYKIYQQALDAESHQLDEIAGGGFRKALEFLVKDYSISFNQEDEEKIQKIPLSQVIKNYMMDTPKITSCATRAIWLGNDEAHYTRKWGDKDITHLKALIGLTFHHIESELLTAQFETDMTQGK
jgi:hypothetical protein